MGIELFELDTSGEEELGTLLLRGPGLGVQLARWAPRQALQLPCALNVLPGAVVLATRAVAHLNTSSQIWTEEPGGLQSKVSQRVRHK